MRNFHPKLYQDLFDEWDDPVIQNHMADEYKIINLVETPEKKTLIDLGAGHGRILPVISPLARNVISIDINQNMFKVLKKKSKKFNNVTPILGDINQLDKIIKEQTVMNPILLILQNTLGTIEGDYRIVLSQMKSVAKKYYGEIIISIYRQRALKGWGLMSYYHGQTMNGEPDLTKTDFKKGLFISKTGYTSKWWTDYEINKIKKYFAGQILNETITNEYWIFHLKSI